ncbi:MAG: Asp-tRNA(Asn)/Glu-tRNA(Gln) amidotransferase subunit GatB [Acidobacteria bacterium]|nr:Asp-tRNA(Asn)/Glu-tRNA(Gln) amidotransferase subunit GatB [Acidobacteriota bacterium]
MPTAEAALATPEQVATYEPVIGLEVHCQLATNTKIFCGCPTSFGENPNSNTCPVCLGLPGALPVLSRHALELAIEGSLALHCEINAKSVFARKNYFYPDLPKGYQISQYDQPLAEHGHVDINVEGTHKRVGVTRVHMEDDAGKSSHDGFKDSEKYSYVDLNRAGTPLIEIVSEPDMRSADEAYAYLTEIKQAMQFIEVSACDMEKGQLRCDANVSVRLKGAEQFGTKVEIKNLNSFRHVKLGIEYEILRQIGLLESGQRVRQQTRLFNPDSGETTLMRDKEEAADYRYFPEPDLLPVIVTEEWKNEIHSKMAELPSPRRARFINEYGLREYDAQVLTLTRPMADYYERAAKASPDPKITANWVMGELVGLLNAAGKSIEESPIPAEHIGELVGLIQSGELSGKLAKEIFPKMFSDGLGPKAIMDRDGLKQISDTGALDKIIEEVLAANPKEVEQYKAGKVALLGFLVGQVMKASKGQANPGAVNGILKAKLES